MDILTKTELEDWLSDLQNIILDVEINISNIHILINQKNKFTTEVFDFGFYDCYVSQSYFICVIQLSKLFSNSSNQKKSFHKLFNKLENFKYDKPLLELLDNNRGEEDLFSDLEKIKKYISIQRQEILVNEDVIKKIELRRDKVYAHSDLKPKSNFIQPEKLKDIEKLKTTAVNIYNSIISGFYDKCFLFDSSKNSWSIQPIIDISLEWEEMKEKKMIETKMS